jgi:hypothetical protein
VNEKEINVSLSQYENLGRLNEDPDVIDARLHAAIEATAQRTGMQPTDLGVGDWAAEIVKKIKSAVYNTICDSEARKTKSEYLEIVDKGTSKEAVAAVSSIITSVLVTLHLTPLAVPSVVLYLAIWLVKVGLNSWCSRPLEQN